MVDVGNARLPANLQKPMNVTDFATGAAHRRQAVRCRYAAGAQYRWRGGVAGLPERQRVRGGDQPWQAPAAVGAVTAGSVTQAAKAVGQCGFTGKPVTFNFQDAGAPCCS